MSAGKYRDKVTVQSCVIEVNDSNEPIETWSEFCSPWASVQPNGGEEHSLVNAQQNLAQVVYVVEMRADPETTLISPSMRILWIAPGGNTVVLAVSAVLPSQQRDVVKLLAQERVADAS